ncbi:hypothetical protein [Bowdeniella massiliensis]|uniref:hypothetical protein n=1 Tax=Bowdeniella massiliensis TaxID=2932264 RepID=UPI0020290BAD|nr:hypothetical protein [Bowdeniella massiliensis]
MARAIAIALVIGFSIGLIYSFVKRNQGGASQTLIRNAVAAGRVALIRIDGIRTTGMFINDQPGELLPGVVLTHDGPEAAFVTDPVLYGEVEARVAGLTVPPAATAGEV